MTKTKLDANEETKATSSDMLSEYLSNEQCPLQEDLSTKRIRAELYILWVIVIVFLLAYLFTYFLGIPYASKTHSRIIYLVFIFFNFLGAYIAVIEWNKLPIKTSARDATLLLTAGLVLAFVGNLIDTIQWISGYCVFKGSASTNTIFIISICAGLPAAIMLGRLCKVKIKKITYFFIATFALLVIPFFLSDSVRKVIKANCSKEFIFGFVYATLLAFLFILCLQIWKTAKGQLRHGVRLMCLGAFNISLGCIIYAWLFSAIPLEQIPSSPVHIIIAMGYVLLGLSSNSIEKTLSQAFQLYKSSLPPFTPLVELWGKEDGIKVYRELEEKIKKSQNALIKAQAEKEKAEASNKAKSAFLAMMSHELKTPLTSIKGYSHLICGKSSPISPKIPDIVKDLGEKILLNSDHLQNMIDSILKFSQLESGKFICEKERFELDKLINSIRPIIQFQRQSNKSKFEINIPKANIVLNTDKMIIRQIITNLLINSFKFCSDGKIGLAISIHDKSIRIIVSDTGIGLTKDQMEHVFDAFYQASSGSKRKYGGSGLGLSVVKKFLDEIGGTIEVESEKGQFTRFIVNIPDIVISAE